VGYLKLKKKGVGINILICKERIQHQCRKVVMVELVYGLMFERIEFSANCQMDGNYGMILLYKSNCSQV